jgi:GTP-binding protein
MEIENKPTIAIVGRSNVGKSTLFNKLIERPKAIVFPVAGTTRDRNYGRAVWQGHEFIFVDTGGIEDSAAIDKEIRKQVDIAIKKSGLIIFLVDLRDGLLPQDVKISKILKKIKKPVILVGNKADTYAIRSLAEDKEWLRLNFGKPIAISAATGTGTGDLLDSIFKQFEKNNALVENKEEVFQNSIKVAIVGKPNAGKSSLLNSFLGEERVLVSDIPFTTREPQDILLKYNETLLLLIDTVGMRKNAKIKYGLEKIGVKRSINAIEKADVVIFVTEVDKPLAAQDKHLSQIIMESNAGLIIVANKWDLIPEKNTQTINAYIDYYQRFFPYLNWAPILAVSAKTGEKVKKILDLIIEVNNERNKNLNQDDLKEFLRNALFEHRSIIHHKKKMGSRPKIVGLTQEGTRPPKFNLLTTSKAKLPEGLVGFIEKRLRNKFGFIGNPIEMGVRHVKKTR